MSEQPTPKTDYGFIAIVALVAAVVVWLLLTPFVSSIASSSLYRFHLRSSSFAWFAIQQPIPSMYNFANRYEVAEVPPGLVDPLFSMAVEPRYINHFPARVLTWSSRRYQNLDEGRDRWVTIESSYRGLTVKSVLHAKPDGEGGFELIRLPAESAP